MGPDVLHLQQIAQLWSTLAGDAAFKDVRKRLSKFKGGPDAAPVPLDGVGGAVLLVKADLHREGLNFPSSLVDHAVETEGFAQLAKGTGHQPFGLPEYVVHHARVVVKPQPTWDRRLQLR